MDGSPPLASKGGLELPPWAPAGVLDGSTSYPHFTSLVPNTDPWPGYLTYTTLRHLALCADTP
ncbi:hypothetical protein ACFWBN_34225 [Streptomyces sp. NPDC059989]|uniref:hypothetical protein n=1 Tax=Streptomyces sp. NPDC059989 TaxID=3347026 RepID=UPI0036CFA207